MMAKHITRAVLPLMLKGNVNNMRPIRVIVHQPVRLNSSDSDEPVFDMKNPFHKERKTCILCKLNITPNYKNVKLLSQFQSPYTGRVYGRHITGLCQHKQKQVEDEIVKAQNSGLMATYLKEAVYLRDPKLFDPAKPIRPHRF